MDHIETKILNSYTIQEAAQNMVFAARLHLLRTMSPNLIISFPIGRTFQQIGSPHDRIFSITLFHL